jgi:branched-chain amino acid aminotransferase
MQEQRLMDMREKQIWWNGEMVPEAAALVPVTRLGWTGVEAVFEGMRGYYNAAQAELFVFRLDAHMQRLMRSMKLMGMTPRWQRDELMDACLLVLRENDCRQDVYLQPLAYVPDAAGGRFFMSSGCAIYIDWWPAPSRLGTGRVETARVSSYRRIGEDAMPPRVKTLSNYRNSRLASREAHRDGYDTAILLNGAGHVAEAPAACVFLVRDGELATPDLTSGILESITRDAIIVLGREVLGLEVRERAVDRSELYVADEVFLVGNAAEVTPITAIDGHAIGDGAAGPVTRQCSQLLHDVARGLVADFASWRAPVSLRVAATAR